MSRLYLRKIAIVDEKAENWTYDPNFFEFANLNTLDFEISKEIDWIFDLSVIIFTSKRSLLPRMLPLSNRGQITLSGNVTYRILGCLRNKHLNYYFMKGHLLVHRSQKYLWHHSKSMIWKWLRIHYYLNKKSFSINVFWW